ncbi:PREDICTED: leucine-rich repeat-containing protein 70-like [Branchiostoma belcheri]|uniref:Leucine-rich repeat-containing protein 70-like n=1 Tax=Branchiostoma belcheri TaxID=7741 RepID=A0A6P5AWM0_BRABE|nr:PREDICTED: leucine-rich repeat-containing protein 70-like [Branchiostoma belcheri]
MPSNIGLTSVPQELPTYTIELYLGYNVITTLSQSDFSSYSSLRELDLQYNQISVINSRAFYSLTRLYTLDLSGNRLTSLRSDVFEGLDNLRYLYLDHNSINIFPEALSLVNILTITMHHNQMTTLPSTAYDILASISYVDISNNPWHGFLGVAVGILMTLAVFLVIWYRKRKRKTSPVPAPDTPQVTTRDGHDVTGTGAAESDDVERALDPEPCDLDIGYRLVRPSLPPIDGTGDS